MSTVQGAQQRVARRLWCWHTIAPFHAIQGARTVHNAVRPAAR